MKVIHNGKLKNVSSPYGGDIRKVSSNGKWIRYDLIRNGQIEHWMYNIKTGELINKNASIRTEGNEYSTYLYRNQEYKVDVDKDGKKETIVIDMQWEKEKMNIYINHKKVKTVRPKNGGYYYEVDLVDLFPRENEMTFVIREKNNDNIYQYTLCKWEGKKLKEFATMSTNEMSFCLIRLARKSQMYSANLDSRFATRDADNEFTMVVDTPFNMPFGCYFIPLDFRIVNGKIEVIKKDVYEVSEDAWNFVYEMEKSETFYTMEDNQELVLPKGTRFRIKAFKEKGITEYGTATAYVQIQNLEDNSLHWVYSKPDSRIDLVEMPVWG